jgi:hypothetical protein
MEELETVYSNVNIITVYLLLAHPVLVDLYEGQSNENLKSAIKIRNTPRLSRKLATLILMV